MGGMLLASFFTLKILPQSVMMWVASPVPACLTLSSALGV